VSDLAIVVAILSAAAWWWTDGRCSLQYLNQVRMRSIILVRTAKQGPARRRSVAINPESRSFAGALAGSNRLIFGQKRTIVEHE
jgi:hypothetical protein